MEYLPVLQSIHSAIDKELKTIKRFGATSRISLFSGKKSQTGFPQKFLYRFEMLIQRILPDGSQCNLVVANKSVEAKVTATEGQFIWLEISTDFGKRITQAYYEVDLSFFLEDLKENYASLIDSKIPINQIYSKSISSKYKSNKRRYIRLYRNKNHRSYKITNINTRPSFCGRRSYNIGFYH
jgi:hypothetical protein